jgi:glycosyltransferase involved in cell wall biosynthesis
VSLYPEKVLMIADVDLQIEPNHRFFHLVRFIVAQGRIVHFVSFANLYGGPPVSLLFKTWRSLMHIIFDRRWVEEDGNLVRIIIRRLKLPRFLQNLMGDLWALCNLPGWIKLSYYPICVYSHPHNAFLVRYLQRRGIVGKVFYDDCDLFAEHLDARGVLAGSVLGWKERLAVNGAEGVISVGQALAHLRKKQGAKTVIVAPNGVELKRFIPGREKRPHPPTLIYIGLLSEAWGVDRVLRAMPEIRDSIPDIKFLIIGSGDYQKQLGALTVELGIANSVQFLGRKSHAELASYLSIADIGVATYKRWKFVEYASSLKVREYLAAGLAVIASSIGEMRDIVLDSGAGQVVEDGSGSIATAVIEILCNRQLLDRYSRNAINYSAQLSWQITLDPVLKLIFSR